MTKIQSWGFIYLLLLLFSCSNPSAKEQKKVDVPLEANLSNEATIINKKASKVDNLQPDSAMVYSFPYQFAKWEQKMTLDKSLMEISGLAFLPSQNQFLAVNDEVGQLFFLDATSGKIIDTKRFAEKGDYEGIALVEDEVFIVKSNGTIYQYNLNYSLKAKKRKTALTKSNDVEGLCYDPANQQLLIACKGNPHLNKNSNKKSVKAVYAFDLLSKRLKEKPIFMIDDVRLESFVEAQFKSKHTAKKRLEKLISRVLKFSPSAIAIHPTEDQYYLLSTVGKTLVVCDRKGNIQHIEFLNDKHHTQPEGLCFSTDGTLYISNEGKGIVGTIYKYKYQN